MIFFVYFFSVENLFPLLSETSLKLGYFTEISNLYNLIMTPFNMKYILIVTLIFLQFSLNAQDISLEDIWQDYKYYARGINQINWDKTDDIYYSLNKNKLNEHVLITHSLDDKADTVALPFSAESNISNFHFSPNNNYILFETEAASLYRRSIKATYLLYNKTTNKYDSISGNSKTFNPSFSPNSQQIAYTKDNNLFLYSITTKTEIQLTTNGEWNKIINGRTDWVYEEEFEFTKAFCWSKDSKSISYIQFDESNVKEYSMQMWGDSLYPSEHKFKYPKAGETNSKTKVYNVNTHTLETKLLLDESSSDNYIARITSTNNPEITSIHRLNRLQNKLEIVHLNNITLSKEIIYTEKSNTYIELNNEIEYLNQNKLLLSSEESGYNHLYIIDLKSLNKTTITKGTWEVDDIIGINNNKVYFTSTELSPLERNIFSVDLATAKKTLLTPAKGNHHGILSPNGKYIIDTFSSTTSAPKVTLINAVTGESIKTLKSNDEITTELANQNITKPEFFKFETIDKQQLNGYIIKPYKFNKRKKHPVLLYVYGGPGVQTVKNEWSSFNYLWFQHLASLGYIIVSVDGRGTGGRGAEFKKQTYACLGEKETEDMIALAKFLGDQKYIDKERIGIWGWSFGGYLTSLCLTKGADFFKTGIAVAPVTSWRFYDTIYTERYMGLPKDNAKGYDNNSPLSHADKLKGNYLIIHGTADDNVHYQNAISFENELIKNNVQFNSFSYPDKNHGIYGGNTRLHLYHMMTNYLKNNL